MATERWVKSFGANDMEELERIINDWVTQHTHRVIITDVSLLFNTEDTPDHCAIVTYYLEARS